MTGSGSGGDRWDGGLLPGLDELPYNESDLAGAPALRRRPSRTWLWVGAGLATPVIVVGGLLLTRSPQSQAAPSGPPVNIASGSSVSPVRTTATVISLRTSVATSTATATATKSVPAKPSTVTVTAKTTVRPTVKRTTTRARPSAAAVKTTSQQQAAPADPSTQQESQAATTTSQQPAPDPPTTAAPVTRQASTTPTPTAARTTAAPAAPGATYLSVSAGMSGSSGRIQVNASVSTDGSPVSVSLVVQSNSGTRRVSMDPTGGPGWTASMSASGPITFWVEAEAGGLSGQSNSRSLVMPA